MTEKQACHFCGNVFPKHERISHEDTCERKHRDVEDQLDFIQERLETQHYATAKSAAEDLVDNLEDLLDFTNKQDGE